MRRRLLLSGLMTEKNLVPMLILSLAVCLATFWYVRSTLSNFSEENHVALSLPGERSKVRDR